MVLLNENWKVVSEATQTPGAANVTYQLLARINSQYHSIELNRDYVEIQVTYTMNSGYIYSDLGISLRLDVLMFRVGER